MTVTAAMRDGVGRVARAPFLVLGTYALLLLVAIPLAIALRTLLEDAFGASLAAERMARGVDQDWWEWFAAQAIGLGTTFTPSIIGFAAVLDNASGLADARPLAPVLKGAVAVYLLLAVFLVGGLLDRLARNRPTRAHGFFAACGVFFFRFLRLGVAALAAYALLFGYVHDWLFEGAYPWLTRDLTVERTAFAARVGLYVAFGLLLAALTLVFDYAKIRAVVEDRRSMIGAIAASVRFIRRHPGACLGVYAANLVLLLLLLAGYAMVAPGAAGSGPAAWGGWAIGQAYVLVRVALKLLFYASQIALFQGALAHAEYAAAPPPIWPESPAAEAVSR